MVRASLITVTVHNRLDGCVHSPLQLPAPRSSHLARINDWNNCAANWFGEPVVQGECLDVPSHPERALNGASSMLVIESWRLNKSLSTLPLLLSHFLSLTHSIHFVCHICLHFHRACQPVGNQFDVILFALLTAFCFVFPTVPSPHLNLITV